MTVSDVTEDSKAAAKAKRPHIGTNIDGAPIGSLLLQVIRAHARLGTELLNKAGVAPPHEIVLFYLDTHGSVPQTDLVHYLDRDRSTVTATLQVMERAGLITRSSSSTDKRAMIVRLSRKGREAVPLARAAWQELERRTASGLTTTQRNDLIDALSTIRDALNGATR